MSTQYQIIVQTAARDSSAAYRSRSPRLTPSASGRTTDTAASELFAKSLRCASPTWRADSDSGRARSSG
jgi:hypothetical protein